MKIRIILIILAICVVSTPSMADLLLYVDIDDATLTYDPSSLDGSVDDVDSSWLGATLYDNITKIDDTQIQNAGVSDDFFFDFDLSFSGSGENWSATGSLYLTDKGSSNVIEGSFSSTNIWIDPGGGIVPPELNIEGILSPLGTNEAILLGSSPWIFEGLADTVTGGGQDLTDNQITINDWDDWDVGQVMVMQVAIETTSLETFFTTGESRTYDNTDVDMFLVPAPAAYILGMLGLSVAGIKLRKYA